MQHTAVESGHGAPWLNEQATDSGEARSGPASTGAGLLAQPITFTITIAITLTIPFSGGLGRGIDRLSLHAVAFFKRVFSADYRRGLAAEAAGEYADAARAYALAGERHKVAEMHLLSAERHGSHDARLGELRAGVRWADGERDEDRAVRRRIARAMLTLVRHSGVLSDSDRAVLREAAALFAGADDP